jgi:subtilisin family serine protease
MDENCRERILSEDYADFMFGYGVALNDITTRLDVCYHPINYNTIAVYTPIANIPKNFIQLYGYGSYPNCYGLLDIPSIESSGVSKIRNIPNLNLSGQGVLIGLIDTGIEYTHQAFIKEDGSSKIYSIWDQSIQNGPPPEGYLFGTEYVQSQINEALLSPDPLSIVPSVDEIGHGTLLAGIAAGSRNEEMKFSGVAPNAEIIMVKMKPAKQYLREFWRIPQGVPCYQKNDLILGIQYIIDTAKKAQRPVSLFIGIGTSQGGHDERGALSSYLSYLAQQNGVAIILAAGNEGNRGHHYMGSIPKGQQSVTIDLRVGPNESGFSMELWGNAPNTYSIDLLSPTGEYIPRIPPRLNESREIRFIFEQTVINVDYQLVESQSGDQQILIRFIQPAEGIWRFKVFASDSLDSTFHMWLPIHQFIRDETFFLQPNPDYTLTSPGNVFIPIVATAYDHTTQGLYINASRGYTRYNGIAPTVAAPGVNILGPTLNNSYTTATGTSLATAHTAGIAALILEWGIVNRNYILLDTVEIRNLLIRGARRDPTLIYPNKSWGYGILDIYNAYLSLRGE